MSAVETEIGVAPAVAAIPPSDFEAGRVVQTVEAGPKAAETSATLPGTPEFAAECEALDPRPLGYRALKRAFDIAFSACVLAVLSPLYAVVAIAVKLDSPGPVIYDRWVVGRDGEPFPMYKFRTMRTEPPEELLSPEQYAQWKAECKVDDDPRITRVGRAIRSVSIDELPQFMDVLQGRMSVIGPRPVTDEEADLYGEHRAELLSVKPGITGYWQAYGREDTSYEADSTRVTMQLYYVRNASLSLDARIFFKTIASVFQRTGR